MDLDEFKKITLDMMEKLSKKNDQAFIVSPYNFANMIVGSIIEDCRRSLNNYVDDITLTCDYRKMLAEAITKNNKEVPDVCGNL